MSSVGSRVEETVTVLADALATAGAATRPASEDEAADLVLVVDARCIPIQIKRWSVFSEHALGVNSDLRLPADPGVVRVVVADRISERGRAGLQEAGWGWLDLRGHLHVQAPGVFIHANVPAAWERASPRDPVSTPAGLEVACALLSEPGLVHPVRALARRLGRAPSTVSEILGALREGGLVEPATGLPAPELFWRVSDVWPAERTALVRPPGRGPEPVDRALQLGFDDVEGLTGWALTDTLAAAAYGAPVAARADLPGDYFVPSGAILRRARTVLGVAPSGARAQATVRVAPVREVCSRRVDPGRWPGGREALAAPLYVALDLSQDLGRGREILDAWDPPEGWLRVW